MLDGSFNLNVLLFSLIHLIYNEIFLSLKKESIVVKRPMDNTNSNSIKRLKKKTLNPTLSKIQPNKTWLASKSQAAPK